jgi:hypothetical protein
MAGRSKNAPEVHSCTRLLTECASYWLSMPVECAGGQRAKIPMDALTGIEYFPIRAVCLYLQPAHGP